MRLSNYEKNGDDDGDCEMIRLNEVPPLPVCIMCRSVDQMLMNWCAQRQRHCRRGKVFGLI